MSVLSFSLLIITLTAGIALLHKKFLLLQKIPLVLLLYIGFMLLANLSLWDSQDALIVAFEKRTISNLLPAMIFLMMLGFDFSLFKKIGSKMLLAFFSTTLSLLIAFVTIFYLFKPLLWETAAASFATLAGSWSGGTLNMIAVAQAIGLDASSLSNVVVVDTILYSFWLMFLLFLRPFSERFNHFSKAEIQISHIQIFCPLQSDKKAYIRIIFIAIALAFTVNTLAFLLPQSSFLTPSFYAVILATLAGLLGSQSFLKQLPSQGVAKAMLYLIIALIASQAKLSSMQTIFSFLGTAALILIAHALIMLMLAKLFKLDLFSVGVASLSHIGGTAGATILASSYDKNLIPLAVIMATAGYLLGTFMGLFIAFILQAL